MSEKNLHNEGVPEMEDYGSPASAELRDASTLHSGKGQGQAQGQGGKGQGDESGPGMFGEFGSTGTGVDLTVEMESNDTDPRSGLVKGGQTGEDAIAGPAQYGGDAGNLSTEG